MKKLLCLCLALLMTVSCVSALAAAKSLPTEPVKMDPAKFYECPVEGLYAADVTVSEGVTRLFHVYYPAQFEPNSPIVYITVPAGIDAEAFIEASGWKQVSDENLILLAILTSDQWADADAELAYIDAVYGFVSSKPYIPVRKHNVYMAAYDGQGLGLQYALQRPNYVAGILDVASAGASQELLDTLAAADSNFFNNENVVYKKSEIIWPAWIVAAEENESVARLVDFLKSATRTVADAAACELVADTVVYASDAGKFDFAKEPEFEAVAPVYVTKADADAVIGYAFTSTVWENLFGAMRRYPTFGEIRAYLPVSEELTGYTRYDAMVYGGDYQDGLLTLPGEYYSRFWYTFVPENIDELDNVPVVFVMHGSGGGPNEIGEQTGWRLLAEKEGIILILGQGSASWGTDMKVKNGVSYFSVSNSWRTSAAKTAPNDLYYVDYMYNWMQTEFAYANKIDMSRIYVSGQSMGGAATYSMISYRPSYFAAAAPASMLSVPNASADLSVDIPVIGMMGQKDTTIRGGFSGTSGMANGKGVFEYFIARYALTEKGDLNRTWDDFTFLTNDAVCTAESGSLNLYLYETEAGIPMFTAIEGQGMGHATSIEQVEYVWENYFTHFTRDPETKVLYYDGIVVDTPVNQSLSAK